MVSREGALVLNNLLLSVILGVVFIGTLYPLVAQAFGVQLSVGPPFFNSAAGPVALALVVATCAGPLLRWRKRQLRRAAGTADHSGRRFDHGVCGADHASRRASAILPLLGLGFAAGLAVASIAPLWSRKLRRTPLHIYGMVLAHLGVAVSIAGMASDSAFKQERLAAVHVGETVTRRPISACKLDRYRARRSGPTGRALEATLEVRRGRRRAMRAPSRSSAISRRR